MSSSSLVTTTLGAVAVPSDRVGDADGLGDATVLCAIAVPTPVSIAIVITKSFFIKSFHD